MTLTENDLRSIVGRASPLGDLLAAGHAGADDRSPLDAAERSSRWRRSVAGGDEARFARRLAWDDLEWQQASAALIPSHATGPLPSWSTLVSAWCDAARTPPPVDPMLNDRLRIVPFVQVIEPLVRVATRRLRERSPRGVALLGAEAQAQLERGLHARLARLCTPTLLVEFSSFRAARSALVPGAADRRQADACDAAYQAFVAKTRVDLGTLLGRYPVLARLAAVATELWIDATAELLDRLETDRELLARRCAAAADLGLVAAIESDLSDPHRGGRTVVALRFDSGLRIVYKPRSLALDESFYALVSALNDSGVSLPLYTPAVIDRGTHGWMEYLTHAACDDLVAVDRFYRRAGMLTCLAYVLGASDLHSQNVLACGEHPILLDLEVLMSAPAEPMTEPAERAASDDVGDGFWDSVLRTQLLPTWARGAKGVDYVDGGLAVPPAAADRIGRGLCDVNTDAMRMVDERLPARAPRNIPTRADTVVADGSHADSLAEGFEDMYRALLRHREQLLRPGGWIDRLGRYESRFVLRDTQIYATLLVRAQHPVFLRAGVDRSIELECIARALVKEPRRPRLWDAFRAEMMDLERGDVPIFTASIADGAITSSANTRVGLFRAREGAADVRRRAETMSMEDLERQLTLIRNSYRLVDLRRARVSATRAIGDGGTDDAVLTRDQALGAADDIARELRRLSTVTANGDTAWVTIVPGEIRGDSYLGFTDASLGQGVCGIALFFAALQRTTGHSAYGDFAMRLVAPLLRRLEQRCEREPLGRELGPGGTLGMGGVVYALTRISDLLDAPDVLRGARHAALAITADPISPAYEHDVHVGTAGAVLGLLALYARTGSEDALVKASAFGRHLAAHGAPRGGWQPKKFGVPTTGFAHGTSGIAHALSALHAVVRGDGLQRAIRSSRAFEKAAFVPDAGNWLECEPSRDESYTTDGMWNSWCHGATGIGLSRAAAAAFAPLDVADAADLAVAVATTEGAAMHPIDTLCCGNMGRVELLLSAAPVLARDDIRTAALRMAGRVHHRARRGCFSTSHVNLPEPGFFQGLAGMGYSFLRCIDASALPQILTWE